MKFWRRYVSRECPPEVIAGLYAVGREYPDCRRWRESHLFYATIGRDRAGLTMDWVDQAREACEREREFKHFLEHMWDETIQRENAEALYWAARDVLTVAKSSD